MPSRFAKQPSDLIDCFADQPHVQPMKEPEMIMKKLLPLFALVIVGCASPYLEGTDGQDAATLARLSSTDREARLVSMEGTRINPPAHQSYFVRPGTRRLEFQLLLPGGGPPGKNMVGGFTPQQEFIEACLDLKPGHDYLIEVDRSRPQRALVVNERNPQRSIAAVDSTC